MKIVSLETFPVSVPYKSLETSSIIARGGVSDVIVKLVTDTGIVGWGEACKATDTLALERAIRSVEPLIVGHDPWNREAIIADAFKRGLWFLHPMIGNAVMAGIDIALWDICGKAVGEPLYRLLGGAMRETVNYAHYVRWDGDLDRVREQAREGVEAGYTVFYMKTGVDEATEEAMLEALRDEIGPKHKIRIDCNQAWSVPEAIRLINRWHAAFCIDFVEAPVRHNPIENMLDVRRAVAAPLSANEGLWRETDVVRMVRARVADYYCFSPHLVGTIRRFMTLAHLVEIEGAEICKHSRGELGISAAAVQHVMLAAPNACLGQQQNATRLEDDIVTEMLPLRAHPDWGLIESPGLGVDIDEEKLLKYRDNFLKNVDFAPYGENRRSLM